MVGTTHILAFFLGVFSVVGAVDISDLSGRLQSISSQYFPSFKEIGQLIHANPELATEEYYAHDLITSYFLDNNPGLFHVTSHAYGFPTAFRLEFHHREEGFHGDSPTFAFMCEYDALPDIGHACGHNHITTVCLTAATLTRQALLDYGISGNVVVYGAFDEEDKAGKYQLLNAGAFNDQNAIFMLAHPTFSSAVQPMGARLNAVLAINEDSHSLAVKNAYKELIIVRDLAGLLPGHSSTVHSVVNVGVYATNVVETNIELGVSGMSLEGVNTTIATVFNNGDTFSGDRWMAYPDSNGVAITFTGPGGHSAEGGSSSALDFSIEVFRALEANVGDCSLGYYLPSNTSHTQLDITVDMRTRYTFELDSVKRFVVEALDNGIPDAIIFDTPYPSLELHDVLSELFLDLVNNDTALADPNDIWHISSIAPAATDASYLQNPIIDHNSFELLDADRVVFHPNYRICEPGTPVCPFNHEPSFTEIADTPYSYNQSERISRALAHLAVELANDPTLWENVRAITE